VGWTDRQVGADDSCTLTATLPGMSAWDAVAEATSSSLGTWWAARDGTAWYAPSTSVLGPPVATLSTCPTPGAIHAQTVTGPSRSSRLINRAVAGRRVTGGQTIDAQGADAVSVARTGERAWTRLDLPHVELERSALVVDRVLARRAVPRPLPGWVTLDGLVDPASSLLLTTVEPRDRVDYVTRTGALLVGVVVGWDVTITPTAVIGSLRLEPETIISGTAWDRAGWDLDPWE
jgi:hypothetical protein